MRKTFCVLICSVLLWLSTAGAQQDPYIGEFSADIDDKSYRLSVERVSSNTYDGLLWIDAEKMQLDGRRYGEQMVGMLANEARQRGFRARIEGSALVLEIEEAGRVILYRD